MSDALSMSLDQAINKRKDSEKFNRSSPNRIKSNRLFTKRRFDRFDRPFFKKDRSPAKRFDRPFFKKSFSPKSNFSSRFIRRTGYSSRFARKDRFETKSDDTFTNENKRIIVSNLDFNITHKDIMDLFSKMGTVIRNKIDYDSLGRSKGKAFVEFDKSESASKAISEFNGALLDGRALEIEYDNGRPFKKSSNLFRKTINKDYEGRRFERRRDDRDDYPRGDRFRREDDYRRDDRRFYRKDGYRRNRYFRRSRFQIA